MRNILITISFLFTLNLNAQIISSNTNKELSFEDKLYTVTTLINVNINKFEGRGTGFFYTQTPDSINLLKKPKIWLISNRHILFPHNKYPDSISLLLRKIKVKNTDAVKWDTTKIYNSYLNENTKFFKNANIDVAALDVSEYIKQSTFTHSKFDVFSLNKLNLIDSTDSYQPEVGDDILSIGYPKAYYDSFNKFPTVKSGIIASRYGSNYGGKPYFIIDAKLFPGSSGSLIISKPKSVVMIHGMPHYQQEKKIHFLGIYSGTHHSRPQTIEFYDMTITKIGKFNTGIVWYAYLIEELINL